MSVTRSPSIPRGIELLRDPHLNKSTAFTAAEREALGLIGLLPPAVDEEELQVRRALRHIAHLPTDLERYIYLISLVDDDETLFYKVVMTDPARFLPIVYDPTVGEACLKFGHIFRRPRGMYITLEHRGHVREVLRNWPTRDVRVVCVSSGERILGLGDLGANGMGIPIGKLQLYTAAAAVNPDVLLPMLLDFGTNNRELLEDPLYLGLRQPRVSDAERDELVEELVQAIQDRFPGCCIHFEDWKGADAVRLLARYRDRVPCFNDDIQGTGGVALAGLLSALRITGGKLRDQRVLFLGAGSAAIGIADLIAAGMAQDGLTPDQARGHIWMFDIHGLIEPSRTDLLDYQKPYAQPSPPSHDFVEVIRRVKPTAIIGVSTKGRAFTREVIEAMASLHERPIVFALSNPTDRAECTAAEAYKWSDGRALYAAGVQFPPVRFGDRTLVPGQGNNLYVFPALGLAIVATRTRRITDEMLLVAARAIADRVTRADLDQGLLYPPQSDILNTEVETAIRIADVVFARNLAGVPRPDDIRAFIESHLHQPTYPDLVPAAKARA